MVKRAGASKFPVARIKKIMQADEDIGKVAQATPVVISKALELFLTDLVKSIAAETRSTGAKKVTAYHLKRAVHTRETLDFLKDIVQGVADPLNTTGPSATTSSSSSGGGGGGVNRKRQPSRKGLKEDDTDDDDDEAEVEDDEGDDNVREDDEEDRKGAIAKKIKRQ